MSSQPRAPHSPPTLWRDVSLRCFISRSQEQSPGSAFLFRPALLCAQRPRSFINYCVWNEYEGWMLICNVKPFIFPHLITSRFSFYIYIKTQRWNRAIQRCRIVEKRVDRNTPIPYNWYTIGNIVTLYFAAFSLILALGAEWIKSARIYSLMPCWFSPKQKQMCNFHMCRRTSPHVFLIVEKQQHFPWLSWYRHTGHTLGHGSLDWSAFLDLHTAAFRLFNQHTCSLLTF